MDYVLMEQKLKDYGADVKGIGERFMGDMDLYYKCFLGFLEEQNFTFLKNAIAEKDVKKVFESAHALKGLSGNMGLTPFYNLVKNLVEKARSGSAEGLEDVYALIEAEHLKLKALLD